MEDLKICHARRRDHDNRCRQLRPVASSAISSSIIPNSYISPTLGCMGPGVPSAVAAKLAHPEALGRRPHRRRRLSDDRSGNGDGETISARKSSPSSITTMAITRFACTRKRNIRGGNTAWHWRIPDFAKLGESYGALGLKVTRDEEFMPALKKAMAADGSALIEVLTDYEYVTPTATLSELAGKTLQGE